MSTSTFERLLYTDCRPGEGLGGGGGYQVQAQSEGCSSAQVRMAVSWLLYSTQTRWINERREAEDFPGGMAHSAEAGYGTAQSKYLGKEVNGNRQGNYLADCLLTDSPQAYGRIRPAQLWGASFWREEAWPTTTAPKFDEQLDVGPLDLDEIEEWVKAREPRAAVLERLLTVLEDPSGMRVIIRADTPDEAMAWIAAGTVLLPIRDAVGVSFRVFANRIDDSPHRVLAVPRELHPNLVPGSRPKTLIIDAATDDSDVVEPSARAKFWVRQLLKSSDPYNVVEAVDLAADFGGRTEQEIVDARSAALVVVDPERQIEDPQGVGRWVRRAIGTVHADAAQAVVDRLISADDVRVDDLRLLDQLASEGVLATNIGDLRARLLRLEVDEAAAGIAPPAEQLPEPLFTRAQAADSESAVVTALILGTDAVVDLELQVAWRHGLTLEPPTAALVDRLRSFVTDWVASADPYRMECWALKDLIADELHEQLRGVYATGQPGALERVLRPVVGYLVRRQNDLSDPFTDEIEACYTSTLKPEGRIPRVRGVLGLLKRYNSEARFTAYQDALVRWYAVDPALALDMIGHIPQAFPVNETIIKVATRELETQAERPDEKVILAIEGLAARNQLLDSPRLRRIARSVKAVVDLIGGLDKLQHGSQLNTLTRELHSLRAADDSVIQYSLPALVAAASDSRWEAVGQSILRYLPDKQAAAFAKQWADELRSLRNGDKAAAFSVLWLADRTVPELARQRLADALRARFQGLGQHEAAIWRTNVGNHLYNDDERAFFDQLIDGEATIGSKRRGPRMWGKD